MPTITEAIQAKIRSLTSSSGQYNEDWNAYADLKSAPSGLLNERVLWLAKQQNPEISNYSTAMNWFSNVDNISSTIVPQWVIVDGINIDNYATTYNQTTWQASNSTGGTSVLPTAGNSVLQLNITSITGSTARVIHKAPFTFGSIADDDIIVLDIECDTFEDSDTLQVLFSSDGYTSKSAFFGFTFQKMVKGRFNLCMRTADFTKVAGEVFAGTTFNFLSIRVVKGASSSAVAKTFKVRGLYRASREKPQIIIAFDKGESGVYTEAFPLMQAAGLKGTIYVTPSLIDTAGMCTWPKIAEMYAAGWYIGLRAGQTHDQFADQAALQVYLIAQRAEITSRGIGQCEHAIYAVGVQASFSRAAAVEAGFKSYGNTVVNYTSTNVGLQDAFCYPRVGAGTVDWFTNTGSTYWDRAAQYGKTLHFYTHQLDVATTPAGGMKTSDFALLVNKSVQMRDGGFAVFPTIAEWYNSVPLS